MDFKDSKYAALFPFTQTQNTSVVTNATRFIDFGLNMFTVSRGDYNQDFCCHATFKLSGF